MVGKHLTSKIPTRIIFRIDTNYDEDDSAPFMHILLYSTTIHFPLPALKLQKLLRHGICHATVLNLLVKKAGNC